VVSAPCQCADGGGAIDASFTPLPPRSAGQLAHLLQPAQQELTEAASLLDLQHWLTQLVGTYVPTGLDLLRMVAIPVLPLGSWKLGSVALCDRLVREGWSACSRLYAILLSAALNLASASSDSDVFSTRGL
jgi:hypothetical protein